MGKHIDNKKVNACWSIIFNGKDKPPKKSIKKNKIIITPSAGLGGNKYPMVNTNKLQQTAKDTNANTNTPAWLALISAQKPGKVKLLGGLNAKNKVKNTIIKPEDNKPMII